MLRDIAARYTMASERRVHAQFASLPDGSVDEAMPVVAFAPEEALLDDFLFA